MSAPTPPEPNEPNEPNEAPLERQPTDAERDAQKQEELQAFNRREQDSAWRAVAYLLTGPLIYGGLGALADHWLGTSWLVGAGIVGGMALSLYLIWFRYGTH